MSFDENPYAAPNVDAMAAGAEWMQTDLAGLAKVATGLSLVYFGIVAVLLSMIVGLPAAMLGPRVLMLIMGGVTLGAVMMFVGPLFCLSVPRETNAQGLIIGSVAFQVINLGIAFLPLDDTPLQEFRAFAQLFGLVAAVLFVLFMRKLALFIGRDDLARRARNILVLAMVIFGVAMVAFALVFAVGPASGLLMFIGGIMSLVLFLMYANLVNSLRKAVRPQ